MSTVSCIPERGPSLLFFSGGTALGPMAQTLTAYTHNSVHIITPFDSGGSSAELRRVFHMPAVGDIRARLLALADRSQPGVTELVALCAHRLPRFDAPTPDQHQQLLAELHSLIDGTHPLLALSKPPAFAPLAREACALLRNFVQLMPPHLHLSGASVGNLMLTAAYFAHGRRLDPMSQTLGRLVRARGQVRAVVNNNVHLCVRLHSGEIIMGQHRFTGKDYSSIASPVAQLHLVADLEHPEPVTVPVRDSVRQSLLQADAICYPMGSFFSSVLANLLPQGMGEAIAKARCPKVFIPNTSPDPELFGQTLADQVRFVCDTLCRGKIRPADVLTTLLVDEDERRYPGGVPHELLSSYGIELRTLPLVAPDSSHVDPEKLCRALLAMTGKASSAGNV